MSRKLSDRINSINNAESSYAKFLFRKFRFQRISFSSHISFLKKCLYYRVRPRFVNFKCYSRNIATVKKVESSAIKRWIQSEIRRWYGKHNITTRLNLLTHSRLSSLLRSDPDLQPSRVDVNSAELDNFLRDINEECIAYSETLRRKKQKKLDLLLLEAGYTLNNPMSDPKFHPRIINLTDIKLEQDEEDLLQKGLF